MTENNYEKLAEEMKSYVRMRYDLIRLELLEKLSRIIALFFLILMTIVLLMTALIYFSFAVVAWLEPCFGSFIPPLCIVGGIYIVLAFVAVVFKHQIFLNPLIRKMSQILFKKDANLNEEDDDVDA